MITIPKGPKGEKHPADVIGAAVMVAKIATGVIEDNPSKAPGRAKGGKKGGVARATKLTEGIETRFWEIADIVRLIDERRPAE